MDHGEITGTCKSCHNGNIAEGKPNDHPGTSEDCNECHSTRTFDR
jgi:hypothetical protein